MYSVSDELPTPAHYLTMVSFLRAGNPDSLQHRLGQPIRQFPAVTPVGLDPIDYSRGTSAEE
jgi:hypothetical protein